MKIHQKGVSSVVRATNAKLIVINLQIIVFKTLFKSEVSCKIWLRNAAYSISLTDTFYRKNSSQETKVAIVNLQKLC